MRQTTWFGLVAGLALLGLMLGEGSSLAQVHGAVIKERQDLMKAQSADVKAISKYAKGQGDQAAALSAANDLVARSSKIVGLFPAGTSSAHFPGKTHAKPDIWTNFAKFKAIPVSVHNEEAKLLQAVKEGDRQATGAALANLGKNGCGACHGEFREKES